MAVIRRVTRIANPHRPKKRRSYRRKKALNTRRRARRTYKRKRSNTRKARRTRRTHRARNSKGRFTRRRSNPRKRRTARRTRKTTMKRNYRRKSRKVTARRRVRRARRSNPVLIELGALNPFRKAGRKRRKSVARRRYRRSHNPRRRARRARRVYRRRRSNPVVHSHRRRRRRHNARRRRHHNSRRRRNPALFGKSGAKDILLMVGGGLVGVAATKFLPTLIPSSMLTSLGSSSLVSVAVTGAGAFLAGWIASKVSKEFGEAVLFGGLMQTGSAILNAFAPPSLSGALALSGVGDIVSTGPFPVPNNQFRGYGPLAPPAPTKGVSGFRGFGPGAFGFRRS